MILQLSVSVFFLLHLVQQHHAGAVIGDARPGCAFAEKLADLRVIHIAEGAQREDFPVGFAELVQKVMRRHRPVAEDQLIDKIALRSGVFQRYFIGRFFSQRRKIDALGNAAQIRADGAVSLEFLPAFQRLIEGLLRDLLAERLIAAQSVHIPLHHIAVFAVNFFGREQRVTSFLCVRKLSSPCLLQDGGKCYREFWGSVVQICAHNRAFRLLVCIVWERKRSSVQKAFDRIMMLSYINCIFVLPNYKNEFYRLGAFVYSIGDFDQIIQYFCTKWVDAPYEPTT